MTYAPFNPITKEAGAPAWPGGVGLPPQIADLQRENGALTQELLRCQEQLRLVFDITEKIEALPDADTIQRALLRHVAKMLRAASIFVDQGCACSAAGDFETPGPRLTIDAGRLRRELAHEINLVRQTQRTRAAAGEGPSRLGVPATHVLLGVLRQVEAEAAVIIAVRSPAEPGFDAGDVLATESVLAYGGHVLANTVMVRHLQQTAVETVRALANAIDAKDEYTCGHSERVGWLARLTGAALGLPTGQLQVLEWAGILHDVGKIGVSDHILHKPGKLTELERVEMRRHARMSYEVLKPVARLGPVLEATLYHHENWDGTGYPAGLRERRIPLFARIIRVVDMFDALTSTRAYRRGFEIPQALQVLRSQAGRGTDPHLTDVFIEAFARYVRERPGDFHERFAHIAVQAEAPQFPILARLPTGGDERPAPPGVWMRQPFLSSEVTVQ
jgi:HD-GYP domain-containing protein (c-di-GMP phosphodiesterase class II)